MFADALVDAFVVSAQYHQVAFQRQSVGQWLVEAVAVRGHKDNFVVGSLRLQIFDSVGDRFGHHDHAGAAAKLVIVELFVFAQSKLPQVMQMHL